MCTNCFVNFGTDGNVPELRIVAIPNILDLVKFSCFYEVIMDKFKFIFEIIHNLISWIEIQDNSNQSLPLRLSIIHYGTLYLNTFIAHIRTWKPVIHRIWIQFANWPTSVYRSLTFSYNLFSKINLCFEKNQNFKCTLQAFKTS